LQCVAVIGLGLTDNVNVEWLEPVEPGAFGFELLLLQAVETVRSAAIVQI
jgi:hypothetical protein